MSPKSSRKCVARSGVFMCVSDERWSRIDSKGMVLDLVMVGMEVGVKLEFWRDDGPICSFSLSISPPLWQESERMVKVAPFGTRFTMFRKSRSTKFILLL